MRSVKLWLENTGTKSILLPDVRLHVKSDETPITKEYLDIFLTSEVENAGNLMCWKLEITPYVSRTLTIAQWVKNNPDNPAEPQPWQVWIDTFDICRIFYVEQLLALLHGLNLRRIEK